MHIKKIPFFGLDRFYNENREIFSTELDKVMQSGMFLKGKEIDMLEKKLSEYCSRKYCYTVSSCTDALIFSLLALDIKPGDEVIVTSFSFISSASAILHAGATPVFVDINPNTCLSSEQDIFNKITEKTKAVILVQLYGQMHSKKLVEDIEKKYGIPVIEDAAQSFGSIYENIKSGSSGTISCLSFDPTKVIGGFGTGGAVLTNNDEIAEKINMLRNHGRNKKRNIILPGYNSQITSYQAALINLQLNKLEEYIDKRKLIAERYDAAFKILPEVKTLIIPENIVHNYHKYIIITENRDALRQFLKEHGIETMIHYSDILPEQPVFKDYNKNDYPFAKKISKQILSLPLYPELKNEESDYICSIISSFFNKYK